MTNLLPYAFARDHGVLARAGDDPAQSIEVLISNATPPAAIAEVSRRFGRIALRRLERSELDDAIASARASWSRISDDRTGTVIARSPSRGRARQTQAIGKRLTRIAVADVAILIAAMVIGWIVPLGIGGAMLVMALLVAATVLFAVWPAERAPTPERLVDPAEQQAEAHPEALPQPSGPPERAPA